MNRSFHAGKAFLAGFCLVCANILSACVTPVRDPQTLKAAAVPETAPQQWTSKLPGGAEPEDWLKQFESQRLLYLVDEALANNLDLAAAAARFTMARHNAIAGFSYSSPRIEFQANPLQANTITGVNSGGVSIWGFVAGWEIDLWGRLSSQAGASYADFVAAAADLENAQLSIAAGVASGWTQLAAMAERRRLAEKELEIRKQALNLTRRRFNAGLSTSLDVRLSAAAVAAAHANRAAIKRELHVLSRDMEIMLGRYPSAVIAVEKLPDTLPPMADIADPMALLSRRPDIAGAEAGLEAAGFRAKTARAAMWPIINLRLRLGGTDKWPDLFSPSKLASDMLISLVTPVFRGGELRARVHAADAAMQAAAAGYAQTILNAWREVENARTSEMTLMEEEKARHDEAEQAIQAENIAERQYRQGLISIFDLINSQTRSISAAKSLIMVRAERALNRIAYHRALGSSRSAMLESPGQNTTSD